MVLKRERLVMESSMGSGDYHTSDRGELKLCSCFKSTEQGYRALPAGGVGVGLEGEIRLSVRVVAAGNPCGGRLPVLALHRSYTICKMPPRLPWSCSLGQVCCSGAMKLVKITMGVLCCLLLTLYFCVLELGPCACLASTFPTP